MSKLFAYMAGGEGWRVRGFKMFCYGGGVRFFFYLLCVCVFGEGGGGQVQYLSFREKKTKNKKNDPLLLINDWSL